MQPISDAIAVLRHAESELRQLLLRAAGQGDYENVQRLADWAKQLSQMAGAEATVRVAISPDVSANGKSQVVRERPPTRLGEEHHIQRPPSTRPTTANAKTRKGPRGEYPKFLRDGEDLLKIGWSKREKKAYRHKAPRYVVALVSDALQRAGEDGQRFAMDQVLPIHDPKSDTDVPAYQAYVSLAWLRKENLIVQHGRQGYSLPPDANLKDAVEQRWKLLPKS